jgi:hypothetical protein
MEEERQMRRPTWKHEVNLNTILLVLSVLVMGVGWGMTWQGTKSDQESQSAAILRLDTRIGGITLDVRTAMAEIQGQLRTYADLPYRVTALESRSSDALVVQKELGQAITQLSSDLRVTREIIQRLDRPITR